MNIAKKLFLVIVLSLGSLQLHASQYNEEEKEKIFTFSRTLTQDAKRRENADDLDTARWMEIAYGNNKDVTEIMNIIDSNESFEDKAKDLSQLKKGTKSFFSNTSSLITAAAAFIIAASIASYFYFMRPWTSSNQ
jgi:hypothetical protein